MKAYKTMLKTEFKLSLRGIDMFIFAICMPIVVTILLGVYSVINLHSKVQTLPSLSNPLERYQQ